MAMVGDLPAEVGSPQERVRDLLNSVVNRWHEETSEAHG